MKTNGKAQHGMVSTERHADCDRTEVSINVKEDGRSSGGYFFHPTAANVWSRK